MTVSLCATFQDLAAQTWQRLAEAQRTGLFWSEETNTETILMELKRRHPSEVAVRAFTKAKEARNGSDWEWWIGSPGNWFGMRVQAKRIKLPDERFVGLHRQKAKGQPHTQINTLIKAAHRDKLTPAYCFYVHSKRWPSSALWASPRLNTSGASPLGCLIAHAGAVRNVGSEALSKLGPVAAPWHLMVCPCLNIEEGKTSAHIAHSLMHHSAAASGPRGILASVLDEEFPLFPPVQSLPNYMEDLFAATVDGGFEARLGDERADDELGVRARQRGLAGFVLIASSELGARA